MEAKPTQRCYLRIGILIFYVLLYNNGVTSENACTRGCLKQESGFLSYTSGKAYEYSFESIMTVGAGLASSEESDDTSLKISGSAKIYVKGDCGYTLQMIGVRVTSTKEGNIEKRIAQTITKPIDFTFVDGYVKPEICVENTDDTYSLNIKRALISLLQTSKSTSVGSETDVFGQCTAHTTSTSQGNTETVTKIRDLTNCAYREQLTSGIINGLTNEKAGIKSSMLVNADYVKTSKIVEGIIKEVHLTEEYYFVGAKKGNGDIKAKVVTNMKLKTSVNAPAPVGGTISSSLIFQKPNIPASKNIAVLKTTISDIIQKNSDFITKDSVDKFGELVRLMRSADVNSLLELSSVPFQNKVLARKVYLDALFRTASTESAKAIIKQFAKFDDKEKRIALLSLNLVHIVDKDVINQITALISFSAPKELFLAVGNLLDKFCRHTRCENAAEIQTVSKKYIDSLKHCKPNTKNDEERILYILKGAGSTNFLANNIAGAIVECASSGRSTRIRVSAIQSLAAASCEVKERQKVLELLRDNNEDSELRIESYLAAIQCPTAELGNEIAEIVNKEDVHQVGGFISSHLRALRDSTDAHREYQRHFLSNIRVTKKFPKDFKRYSYSNEVSYRLDAFGLSASADYNLIYSQKGFLPRSARLNITSEIFGMNFNVIEAGIRQDNLETLLEYYFGPKGLLNKDFDEIIKVGTSAEGTAGIPRSRRSIADESNKFAKKYKSYGSKNIKDLNLDMSIKLFGSEMFFLSLGDEIPSTLDEMIQIFSTAFDDVKKEVSNFEKDFRVHCIFLDTELIYPTGIGMPLELSAQGLSANKLNFGVNLDADAILTNNWQRAKYRLKIIPSTDVTINFRVGFNAYVLSTGLRVSSSLHSATGADITTSFTNDGGLTADIQLPREKLDLINVQTNTEFFIGEQDKLLKTISPKLVKKAKPDDLDMCFDQLKAMGLTVCFYSQTLYTSKSESQSGLLNWMYPRKAGVFIKTERNYHFKGYHIPQSNTGTRQWKLEFSTPGSMEPHDTALTFELGEKPRTFGRLSLDNSLYHFAIESGFNNDDKEMILYAQYEHNDQINKNIIGFEKRGAEYYPVIKLKGRNDETINNINGYHADGVIRTQKLNDELTRYNFVNFQIIKDENERFIVNGYTDIGQQMLNAELRLNVVNQIYLVKSNVKIDNGVYQLGAFVNDERTPDNIFGASINVSVRDAAINLELLGKAYKWEVFTKNNIEYTKSEDQNIITSSVVNSELAIKRKQQVLGSFELKAYNQEQNRIGLSLTFVCGKHSGSLSSKYQVNQHSQNDLLIEINGKFDKHFIDLITKYDVVNSQFVIDNAISTSWGTMITAKGRLGQRYTLQDIFVDIHGTVQLFLKDQQSQWILKIIGAPEKTISDFKITREKQEFIKYNAEIQHPQDKINNAKLNLLVRNIISSKAELKVSKNGKGELSVIAETLYPDAAHKLDINSKFHIQTPIIDVETAIVVDGKKAIYFKSENNVDKSKFATKNNIEFLNKKVIFEMNSQVKGTDWRTNIDVTSGLLLQIPSGYIVNGSFKRKITTNAKTGLAEGLINIQLNDEFNNSKRSVGWNIQLEKYNVRTKDVSVKSQLKYTAPGNKQIAIDGHLKHVPKENNKYKFDFEVSIVGNELGIKNSELVFVLDDYDIRQSSVLLRGKYSDQIDFNINANYKIGEQFLPLTYTLKANTNMPSSSFKSFDVNIDGKILNSENGNSNVKLFEVHYDDKFGSGKFLKLNSIYRGSINQGLYNLDIFSHEMQTPFTIEGSYNKETSNEATNSGKQKYLLNFTYADKYFKSLIVFSYMPNGESFVLHHSLDSNFQSTKAIDIQLESKKLNTDGHSIKGEMQFNRQIYSIDSKFYHGLHKKGLEVKIKLPQNNEDIIALALIEILGENKFKVTTEFNNLLELDLKSYFNIAYTDVDNFNMDAHCNSNRLKLNNYDLEIKSQNKAITFYLKDDKSTIFSGTAAYILKKERNKIIIEGQGQIQYQGKSQNTNFKLIRQIYDLSSDKEIGFAYTFNGNFGLKNGVSTLKFTNKEFNVKVSICEEKKQCTNVQIQSTVGPTDESDSISSFEPSQHALLVLLDLRELGYPYEFELQSKTIRNGLKVQYSLDSNIISNNNLKYQITINILPSLSKIQIILPTREILLENQIQHPETGIFGKYEHSTLFYFDKTRKPNDFTRLVSTLNINGVEKALSVVSVEGEIRLEHPDVRPLSITGVAQLNREEKLSNIVVNFDIFTAPEQKITFSSVVKNVKKDRGFNISINENIESVGLGIDYQLNSHIGYNIDHDFSAGAEIATGSLGVKANALVTIKSDSLILIFNALDEDILYVVGEFNPQKHIGKFNIKIQPFIPKPVEMNGVVQPSQTKLEFKQHGITKASVELITGKELTFFVNGHENPLVNGKVILGYNDFLHTTYSTNAENIKIYLSHFIEEAKKEYKEAFEKLQTKIQKIGDEVQLKIPTFKFPDLTKARTRLGESLKEISHELEQDPTLKPFAESYRKIYKKLSEIGSDVFKVFSKAYEQLQKSFASICEKLKIIYDETILPLGKKFVSLAAEISEKISLELSNILTDVITNSLNILEEYGPVFKKYVKAILDVVKPYNESLQNFYEVVSKAFEETNEEINKWIEKLPSLDVVSNEIKDKFTKLKLSEKATTFLNIVYDQLHVLPTTAETSAFIEKLYNYLSSKLKGQNVNDTEVMDELFKMFIKALRSVWASIEVSLPSNFAGLNIGGWRNSFSTLRYTMNFLSDLPGLLSLRLSILNYIWNNDWLSEITWNDIQSFMYFNDFNLKGHIVEGRHIFTFDNQYFNFRGNCKYILAQDAVDNNFTVIAQVNGGKLKAIILSDRDGNYLEINDAGSLKQNGNEVEYPIHVHNSMHAWRKYYTLWLLSEYGVTIMCSNDLKVCHVDVNGFYTSKTRGLLGNGNAEPYDDFIQVDGTIAPETTKFVNNYGLDKCNAVNKEPYIDLQRSDICSEIFGIYSPLALGYLISDPRPYRKACDYAVQTATEKDKEMTACNFAFAYGSAVTVKDKNIILPSRCLKCAGVAGQRELYQEFTVKIPNTKADIVFVVDMNTNPSIMTNVVAPSVIQLRDSLKTRGFTDVQIGVIVYNETQTYPAILTSDNGKINYHGNLAAVELNGPKNFCEDCLSEIVNEQYILDAFEIIKKIIKNVVPQTDELAFELAMKYPFRAGASKSIVDVRSKDMKYGNVAKFLRAHIAESLLSLNGVVLHLVTPVNGMVLEGVPADKLIGFNSRLIATIDGKDVKKRQKLQFETDMAIDFVLNSGGWVFDTQNINNLKPGDQKKALTQILNSISDTLFKTEIVSDCKCVPVYGIHAQHRCNVKTSNFVPNKKPKLNA